MSKLSIDKGRELTRVRTVKSWGAHRIVLCENWLALEPGKKGVPVKGCEITVGKAGAGATVAGGLALGPAGAIVTKIRQCVRVSGGGYSFTAYCYGRDGQELYNFIQAVQAQAAAS